VASAPAEAVAPVIEAAPMAPPVAAPIAPPVAVAPVAPAPAAQRPLVDETDWRVTRPAVRPAVRSAEPASRPMVARPAAAAAESRSPNLFQRITGAFATPKGLTPVVSATPAAALAATPAEPAPAPRLAPENVVAVAPKAAARPAPVQTSISLDVTERAKPARDDDDLQIPAFLRRQAN
jgi:cell division protein FtsZ